ncbi:MAG: glycosyltransferase involved in cell wall biosynthesis, partial [Planctomycetota bacterium]
MKNAPYKLAYLVSHPIQYQAPLLRYLASQPDIDLTVFFLSDLSMQSHTDRGFGTQIDWDVPLVEGYRHHFLPSWYGTSRLNFAEPMVRGLRKHLEGKGFDALWIHGWFHQVNLRAIRLARSINLPVFMRGESLLHDSGWKGHVKGLIQRRVLDNVDRFLAIGTRNAEFYRHHGVSDERIFNVPYAVDNNFFRERAEAASSTREDYRAELNLEPGRPVILFASKFITRKRPIDLLNAYYSLAARGNEPVPYLLFAGSGEEEHNLRQAAWQTGMDSIRFLGFRNQTELPRLYDLCNVFVLPSDYEPWGLVLNEVMNAGRPIITSDCVGAAAD